MALVGESEKIYVEDIAIADAPFNVWVSSIFVFFGTEAKLMNILSMYYMIIAHLMCQANKQFYNKCANIFCTLH